MDVLHVLARPEPLAFAALLAVALFCVARRGDRAEKAGMAVSVIASIVTVLVARRTGHWLHPEIGILIVDLATLVAFVAIMGRSRSFWPMWVVALQIVTVAAHLARLARPTTARLAYGVAGIIWSYAIVVIIAGAAWRRSGRRPDGPRS